MWYARIMKMHGDILSANTVQCYACLIRISRLNGTNIDTPNCFLFSREISEPNVSAREVNVLGLGTVIVPHFIRGATSNVCYQAKHVPNKE